MNAREAFPGTGMNPEQEYKRIMTLDEIAAAEGSADDAFADAVQGALSEPIPTGAGKDRGIFERSIAARRAEKAKQQEIARAALAKAKQLTASIRSMEDALDGLLVSEL